jgi:hypothetical protein
MVKINQITVLFITLFILSFNINASDQGGQFKTLGNWDVHYIAFPSTFLQPKIAKHYGIERSNYAGVVNISVLDNRAKDTPAQKVKIKGVAKNLIGHVINLEFKEVVEGDSVYYIAPIKYRNEETYRFELEINQGKEFKNLKFQQKFYVD